MRRWRPLLLLCLAAAAPDPAVYACRVSVTGTDPRARPAAVEACLRQVLVKLSGNPAATDVPLPPGAVVDGIAYLDTMTDLPLHDEQGTRDRPFDFTARVAPEWAEQALRHAGLAPWTDPRPVLAVRVAVTDMKGVRFELTGDGSRGERQRRALLEAAERFAVRVSLPLTDEAAAPSTPILSGVLAWSDADHGWVADWFMGQDRWTARGVSFDAAFRAGVGGAARNLAQLQQR